MSQRPRTVPKALEHAVQIHLATRNLAELGEQLYLMTASKLVKSRELAKKAREILRRTRQLEGILFQATPHTGKNVVDITRRVRRRAIDRALGIDSRPPPRAA